MQIYNTLTRKKEPFKTIEENKVKMYVCGPTVYDFFHIGNARSFVMADTIRKALEFKGYDVKFVMNLTDIDDKIINRANKEGTSAKDVAEKYSKAFFEDTKKLKIKPATVHPKATEHIQEIIEFIKDLIDKGYAYNIDGDVYFDISKYKDYGKLSGKKIEELEAGARVEVNEKKKNPLDFALWKKAKPGEPYWESPWGIGRPGWHIECSAMSCKHLGETIDIHAGGSDLIFPHHENEIAQSEARTGKKFVNYWIHFGFLNIDNEKMSKSLGNFFTTREILTKYRAQELRFLYLQTHYASPLNFTIDALNASKKGLEKIEDLASFILDKINKNQNGDIVDFNFNYYYQQFELAIDDDFNFPKALAVVFEFVRDVNKLINENSNLDVSVYKEIYKLLQKTADGVLSIVSFEELENKSFHSLEDDLIKIIIEIRKEAKLNKNYALADKIRDELKKIGIILQDAKDGVIYKKEIR
ncbi:MAG TPA: cysteine--tRNA ligase [Ignavibacteriales bacterium]|nr:cysteine--tRNA ligase [Ignavibacteriales bacterium]HOL81198.1 cysteine--tRNA ligase [Ignavibacteriales bacterium]HPD68111.1 cysteine--tRNA ligase [Ignavibacteriales bacterium]HPP33446.1 cysteine--tRNA ligase [Ignavibacteriales bacterium]HRR18360.1 cysteine--tRNA ligase [Ignavibacteriales bacterium]